jgi:hypothetical protein
LAALAGPAQKFHRSGVVGVVAAEHHDHRPGINDDAAHAGLIRPSFTPSR